MDRKPIVFRNKKDEASFPKLFETKRTASTIPGLSSTWHPKKGPFKAPPTSPGPRTLTNLFCLSEPMVDRLDRQNWASYNNNSQYIQ